MASIVRINEEIKQIKEKSSELGITQYELLNHYLIKGLDEDNDNVRKPPSVDEIKARLKYDIPKGRDKLHKYAGIGKAKVPTDAVELKRHSSDI